ncbi:thioredoxin-like protein 4A-like protein, partial [Byssothecium circinans]
MTAVLPLPTPWNVDQAIVAGGDHHLVVIRFGRPSSTACAAQDRVLAAVAEQVASFADVYTVDITRVTEFNAEYQLVNDTSIMFFFAGRHIRCDCGTGEKRWISWVVESEEVLKEILETVWRGAGYGLEIVDGPEEY